MTLSLFNTALFANPFINDDGLNLTSVEDDEPQLSLVDLGITHTRGQGPDFSDWDILSLDAENLSLTAEQRLDFLTSTTGDTLGAVGFYGDFALTGSPSQMIDVAVTFVTPPAVALRLLGDMGHSLGRGLSSYEATALEAHALFDAQVNSGIMPFSSGGFTIVSRHHSLFNGVFMTISADLIDWVASLDGVYAVSPAPTFSTTVDLEMNSQQFEQPTAQFVDAAQPALSAQSVVANPPPARSVPRDYFNQAALDTWNIEDVWAGMTNRPGEGLRIGVLDTGVDYFHPVFQNSFDPALGRMRGENFIPTNPSAAPASWIIDPDNIMERRPDQHGFTGSGPTSHGTHVAGTIAAIAPYATLYHYRVLSGSTPNTIITSGIEAAHLAGMDIVNMSLGANVNVAFDVQGRAINLAVLDGITFVISAGNGGADTYRSHGVPSATAPLSIAVGAGERGGVGTVSIVNGAVTIDGTEVYARFVGRQFGFTVESLSSVTEYVFLGLTSNLPGFTQANITPAFIQSIRTNHLGGGDLTGQIAIFSRGFDFTDMRSIAQALNAAGWMVVCHTNRNLVNSLVNPAFASTVGGVDGANRIGNWAIENLYAGLFTQNGVAGGTPVAFGTTGTISITGELHYVPAPDHISTFSARGPINVTNHVRPDIVGPGTAIISAVPSFVINQSLSPGYNATYHALAYGSSQGTSMSAPAIAGLAALLLTENPLMPPYEVKARLMNTADLLTETPRAGVATMNGGDFYSVFNQGAGFANPTRMFAFGDVFATIRHDVPHGGTAANQEWLPNALMSSFSFGNLVADTPETLRIDFHGGGAQWTPNTARTGGWVQFNGDANGIAITFAQGATYIDVTVDINDTATENHVFEGYLHFTNGTLNMQVPFGFNNQGYINFDRFSVDMDFSGVHRPIVSGFVRPTATDPDFRHIITTTPFGLTPSNRAAATARIVDADSATGTVAMGIYAKLPNGEFARVSGHNAFPVNADINLTDFVHIGTDLGRLGNGVWEFYLSVEHPLTPFFGPLGTNNRIVVTEHRPTVNIDPVVYFTPSATAQEIQIQGNVNSFGHELAMLHDVQSNDDPGWAVDYFYANIQVFLNNSWQRIAPTQVDPDTGDFLLGLSVPANFTGTQLSFRVIDGWGLNLISTGTLGQNIGANLSEIVTIRLAPEPTITFGATNAGGEVYARVMHDDGSYDYITTGTPVAPGSTVQFYAVPEAGIVVSRWSLGFASSSTTGIQAASAERALPTFTITNLAFDHHVTVTFASEVETPITNIEVSGNQLMAVNTQQQLTYRTWNNVDPGTDVISADPITWSLVNPVAGVSVDSNGMLAASAAVEPNTTVLVEARLNAQVSDIFEVFIAAAVSEVVINGLDDSRVVGISITKAAFNTLDNGRFQVPSGVSFDVTAFTQAGYIVSDMTGGFAPAQFVSSNNTSATFAFTVPEGQVLTITLVITATTDGSSAAIYLSSEDNAFIADDMFILDNPAVDVPVSPPDNGLTIIDLPPIDGGRVR
jgi:hypothetical protein